MKTIIRVKEENLEAVVQGLKEAGFSAEVSRVTPLSQWEHDNNSNHDFEHWSFQSLIGMRGIETSASQKQAHQLIKALKKEGKAK
jgi:hypothetical protein